MEPRVSDEVLNEIGDIVSTIEPEPARAQLKERLASLQPNEIYNALNAISTKYKMNALVAACAAGPPGDCSRENLVADILVAGALVNGRGDTNENTALHIAALHLRTSVVVLLRRYGASIYLLNSARNTALHLARDRTEPKVSAEAKLRSVVTAKLLVAAREETTTQLGVSDVEDAFIAIQQGAAEKLAALSAKSSILSLSKLSSEVRWTALHYAVAVLNVAAVKVLVKAPGADANAADEDGWTPLHWVMVHRCIRPEVDGVCLEIFKLLETVPNLNYWPRVCSPKLIAEPLVGSCFVTEVAPDWRGKTQERKEYIFYFNKPETSEEYGVDRFLVTMWYDGNPAEEVIGLFEPNKQRRIAFRRRGGTNENILDERNRTVFFDDLHGVISLECEELCVNKDLYATSRGTFAPHKDWAMRRVPTLLPAYFAKSKVPLSYVADKYEFRLTRIERIDVQSELYAVDVFGESGTWMLQFIRLEGVGTQILLKKDGKVELQTDIYSIARKEGNNATKLLENFTGPNIFQWASDFLIPPWLKMLLDKPECNPFDGGFDGRSPFLTTLLKLKELEDASDLLKSTLDASIALIGTEDDTEEEKKQRELTQNQARTVADEKRRTKEVVDSIRGSKKCVDRITAELRLQLMNPTVPQPSLPFMLYALEFDIKFITDATELLGVTTVEAKMFLLHNAIACGSLTIVKKVLELNEITDIQIDNGRKLGTDVEYALAVAAKYGKLDIIKYLVDDMQAEAKVGNGALLREAMRAGHVKVATWMLDKDAPAPGARDKPKPLPHLPSATGATKAAEGNISFIPRVEELKLCSERHIVTTKYFEDLVIRSYTWDNADDPDTGSQRGAGTALLLLGMQNDYFEYVGAEARAKPIRPVPGTNEAYVKRVTNFLESCMRKKTTINVDYFVCVNNWHPENHCSFVDAPLLRDPSTGVDPRTRARECIQNTWGAEVHADVTKVIGEVAKHTRAGMDGQVNVQSAFFEYNQQARTGLHDLLQGLNVSRVLILGLPLESVVLNSVADALYLGYDVTVAEKVTVSVLY